MIRQLERRIGAEGDRAATLELFYDLVFVFAITQVSHLLLEHLTWASAGQALIILLAVWWSWNYTTWATNELNPESNPVRLLLIALMLAGLLMAVAIPDAFGDKGLLFAGAYVAIQVGRHLFLTFVSAGKGSNERTRAGRILIWFLVAGCFWIAGGIADDGARVALWIAALVLDYGAPPAPLSGAGTAPDLRRRMAAGDRPLRRTVWPVHHCGTRRNRHHYGQHHGGS